VEIAEVVDRKSLKAYLEGLEGNSGLLTARRVAFFAAISVAPAALRFFAGNRSYRDRDLTPLAVLGAYSISGVRSTIRTPEIARAASASAAAAAFAASAASASAARAARAAASAARAAFAPDSASADAFASDAAAASADASASADAFASAFADAYFWGDLRSFLTGQRSAPDAPMPAITLDATRLEDWNQTCILLKADSAVDWTFWIAWFDRALAGKDIHADMLAPILNGLTEDDWLGDPAKVNPLFDDVLAVYHAENTAVDLDTDVDDVIDNTPLGEDLVLGDDSLFHLVPTDTISEAFMPDILGQIASARRILTTTDRQTNAYQPLAEELRILEDAESIHNDRPVLILKDVSRVLKRLAGKIKSGDCPTTTQDANIGDFQGVLVDVQLELVGLSPEVRAYHEAVRPEVNECALPQITAGANAMSESSDVVLSEILESEIETLSDLSADDDARRNAFYRITGLVVRGYKAARPHLKETAAVIKDASIVVGAVGSTGGTILWFASPAFQEFVKTVLKSFVL
jgi:hypothetical protein